MRNLIYYRDLLINLVQREIKIHYRRSYLGILWAQLNPLLSLIIFSFVFQTVVPLNIPNYPAYVFTGLLAWNWFSTSLNMANYTITNSKDLVRQPGFAVEMLPVVSVTANMVNYLLAMPVLIGLLLINNLTPNWTLIFFPVILAIQFLFIVGLSLIISSITVFFRDVLHLVAVAVAVLFYLTPVFYSVSPRSEYQYIINFNPMTHILNAYRDILLRGQPPNPFDLFWLSLLALGIFVAGLMIFRRLKYQFVDIM